MRLGTRLWTAGALVPAAVMAVGLLVAGQAFRAALQSSLDQGLLAQAAAESVSLFDRVDGPHLHMAESPLLEAVRPFAPTGALFDDRGELVAHFPPLPHPTTVDVSPPLDGLPSELTTRERSTSARQRELVVRVKNGDGRRYVLRLSASLAQVDESVRAFYEVALVVVVTVALLLATLQIVWGRRLSRRLAALSEHLARVRRGELDVVTLQTEREHDEVSELADLLTATTAQLLKARAAQDRLLADAAHELRTPLTLMRTTLDLALRKDRSPAELRAALDDARSEVDRLARLATALLDVASAARGWDLTTGELASLVDEACEGVRAAAEEVGVWVEVECERPARARFNATALRQALDNLLSNALRFAPKGTAIRVTVAAHGSGWRLAVRDRGPGIPAEQREVVFAPFHRGDPRGGSGLGLAIASEVMRQHEGSASALTPDDGGGALVVLDLPA